MESKAALFFVAHLVVVWIPGIPESERDCYPDPSPKPSQTSNSPLIDMHSSHKKVH